MDKIVLPGIQGGPLVHIIAAKAVCLLEAMRSEFKDYARQVIANAKVLAQKIIDEGFRVISGGTDTHLFLMDVFSKGMLGSEAETALGQAGITVNKNAIPFDINPYQVTGANPTTHFEQVYQRAINALNNAVVAFDDQAHWIVPRPRKRRG